MTKCRNIGRKMPQSKKHSLKRLSLWPLTPKRL